MELLEIEPRELKFTFELKKQSSCSVHLVNRTNEYVAFKVKTTSPKRYCVRPNTGVILPRSTMDFTVTMQAQKTAPPDMQLKDKFLIQTTIAPYGSGDEDILPALFSKESGKYVDEAKLRVVLVSPPNSPVLQPINGALKQEPINEAPVVKENLVSKDQAPLSGVVNFSQVPLSAVENSPPTNVKELEVLKLKISNLESKLNEAEKSIVTLKNEKSSAVQQREKLQQELELLRRRPDARVQVGFPFLFVVFMALVGAFLGHLMHQ